VVSQVTLLGIGDDHVVSQVTLLGLVGLEI
jgi:hypothetical protein